MSKKQVLLLCGGGSSEHEISLNSSEFINSKLQEISEIDVHWVEMLKDGNFVYRQSGEPCELTLAGALINGQTKSSFNIDFAIPCLHGFPGETGDIQSLFELARIPYLGCNGEASRICFNKITTKQWLTGLHIPNTPYSYIYKSEDDYLAKAKDSFANWNGVFIKPASEGSSVGCYLVDDINELKSTIEEVLTYSDHVLLEKPLKARELEVAAYEKGGKLVTTLPGEICTPTDNFYTFEEKYSEQSGSETKVTASELTKDQIDKINDYSKIAFKGLGLRHLSRIDFFLTEDGEVLLNEINTFPGMTSISMFPKMMENNGDNFTQFLKDIIL